MPYKEKDRVWRAKVKSRGEVYTKRFETKGEALDWERDKRKELKAFQRQTLTASLHEAATDYLAYCEKAFHKSTFTDRRKALKELLAVTGNIGLESVEPKEILNNIILQQRTPQLANKRRKDLHAFFEYCRKFHGLRYNPVSVIDRLPQERQDQPVPTDGELARLKMAAEDRQDRNLLTVLANCGARRSEIFRITFSQDVDFPERMLRLGNRKNKKREMRYRFIPMNEDLYKALKDQFRHRLPDSDYAFQNRAVWKDKSGKIVRKHPDYGKGFTTRRRFMLGLCEKAKVKPMGFHALRRYFASKLVENREDLETIRQLMGHEAVSTTDRYIYRLKADLRSAVEGLGKQKGTRKGTQKQKGGSQ